MPRALTKRAVCACGQPAITRDSARAYICLRCRELERKYYKKSQHTRRKPATTQPYLRPSFIEPYKMPFEMA